MMKANNKFSTRIVKTPHVPLEKLYQFWGQYFKNGTLRSVAPYITFLLFEGAIFKIPLRCRPLRGTRPRFPRTPL